LKGWNKTREIIIKNQSGVSGNGGSDGVAGLLFVALVETLAFLVLLGVGPAEASCGAISFAALTLFLPLDFSFARCSMLALTALMVVNSGPLKDSCLLMVVGLLLLPVFRPILAAVLWRKNSADSVIGEGASASFRAAFLCLVIGERVGSHRMLAASLFTSMTVVLVEALGASGVASSLGT
jgi:hypothetical protein